MAGKAKPNGAQRSGHTMVAMTEKQALRIASGQNESKPGDYRLLTTDKDMLAAAHARRVLEDRRIDREAQGRLNFWEV